MAFVDQKKIVSKKKNHCSKTYSDFIWIEKHSAMYKLQSFLYKSTALFYLDPDRPTYTACATQHRVSRPRSGSDLFFSSAYGFGTRLHECYSKLLGCVSTLHYLERFYFGDYMANWCSVFANNNGIDSLVFCWHFFTS